jgi:hypothetical protein
LQDAEDALMKQGFRLAPNTCNWINADGADAGVYPVEESHGVSKYRIEYRRQVLPVDLGRRGFLSRAAGVAAGSAALALATVAPKPATAAPSEPLDGSNASPALRAAARTLDDAHERLKAATAANDAADELFEAWCRQNPSPESKRGRKRYIRKANAYHRSVMADSWEVLMEAETVFHRAQIAAANVPAANMNDLRCKAALSCVYDEVKMARANAAPIGRTVAWGLLSLGMAVQS